MNLLTEDQIKERRRADLIGMYEESPLKKFENGTITMESGWSFGWPDDAPEPKPGDIVRLYGKGIGYTIVGADLNGEPVWYKTQDEVDAEHQRWLDEIKERHEREAEEHKDQRAAEFEELLPNFKARILRFRAEKSDFQVDGEPYETFPLLTATRLLKRARTDEFYEGLRAIGAKVPKPGVESRPSYTWEEHDGTDEWEDTIDNRILAFHCLNTKIMGYDYEAQKRLAPDCGIDQHSGNTYGYMIAFARREAAEPGFEC